MRIAWKNTAHLNHQSRVRVMVIHIFSKMLGVLVHVEGCPYGSNRTWKRHNIESGRHAAFGGSTLGNVE